MKRKENRNHAAIKIDKGIPIPRSGSKYPISALGVGDSFLLPAGKYNDLYVYARLAGIKIAVRTTPTGVRVWRKA